jgi:hypothetical protein
MMALKSRVRKVRKRAGRVKVRVIKSIKKP